MSISFTYYRAGHPVHNAIAKLKFRRVLLQVTNEHSIEGFTLISTLGAWHGKTEPSYLLEVENVSTKTITGLAKSLKAVFNQEAIMLKTANGVEFI
jgi:hypothetical protein